MLYPSTLDQNCRFGQWSLYYSWQMGLVYIFSDAKTNAINKWDSIWKREREEQGNGNDGNSNWILFAQVSNYFLAITHPVFSLFGWALLKIDWERIHASVHAETIESWGLFTTRWDLFWVSALCKPQNQINPVADTVKCQERERLSRNERWLI